MPDEKIRLDPWASQIEIKDYDKIITDWGLSRFKDLIDSNRIKNPHPMMRRGILFAHRDFDLVLDRIEKRLPFVMLTGLMPSGKMHLGHKLVVDQMKWYQENGAELIIVISDIEAWLARRMPPSETTKIAIEEYITNYLALGLEYRKSKCSVYSQWKRAELLNLAAAFSARKTFGEMNAIYGFIKPKEDFKDTMYGLMEKRKEDPAKLIDLSISAGKTFFPFIQAADILHPQLELYGGARPTVVPVGIDQDPHIRLTRDIAADYRLYNVAVTTEKDKRTGVGVFVRTENNVQTYLDKAEASLRKLGFDEFEKVPEYRALYILYASEVDIPAINESLIEAEKQEGRITFYPPASTYHKLAKGLTSGKMSSSAPESAIYLTDSLKEVERKIKFSKTGGRETLKEQKEKGGEATKCPVYDLLLYHHPSDDFVKKVFEECYAGEIMCGMECKSMVIEYFLKWMKEHHERREKIKESGELERFLEKQDIINEKDALWF